MSITRYAAALTIGIAFVHGEFLGAAVLFLVSLVHEIGVSEADAKKEGEEE